MIRQILLAALLVCVTQAQAFEAMTGHDHNHGQAGQAAKSHFEFRFPAMSLVDHRNRTVELGQLFAYDENVVFAFFFTHCVAVCTTLTQTLKNLQPRLPEGTRIAMISIDPDTDTPELLSDYVDKHGIDDRNWSLLTGDNHSIVELQKSFEAYRGNKMNHSVSLFLKKSGSDTITEIQQDFARIPGLMIRG